MNYSVFPSNYEYDQWLKSIIKKLRATPYTFQVVNNEILKVYNNETKSFDNYIGIYWIKEKKLGY